MIKLETILFEYFSARRTTLEDVYDWDIPQKLPIPFIRSTDSRALANVRLRRELQNAW
jgi:hypothetical protein